MLLAVVELEHADGLERIATVAEDWHPDILLLAAPGKSRPVYARTEFDRLAAHVAARPRHRQAVAVVVGIPQGCAGVLELQNRDAAPACMRI